MDSLLDQEQDDAIVPANDGHGGHPGAWVLILGVSHAQAQTYTRYVWGGP